MNIVSPLRIDPYSHGPYAAPVIPDDPRSLTPPDPLPSSPLVPPAEVCKRLEDKGFPRVTHFYYWLFVGAQGEYWVVGCRHPLTHDSYHDFVAAPTAGEIADQIPLHYEYGIGPGKYGFEVDALKAKTLLPVRPTLAWALAEIYLSIE
jgi:hypothetical protein